MSTKLVRCVEGHVFDSSRESACPACGASALRQDIQVEEAPKSDVVVAPERKRVIRPAHILIAIAGAGVVIFGAVSLTRPTAEEPKACCVAPPPQVVQKDVQREQQLEPVERAPSPDHKSSGEPTPTPAERQMEPPLEPSTRDGTSSASLEPTPADTPAEAHPAEHESHESKPRTSTNIFSELPDVSYPPKDVLEVQKSLDLSDAVVDVTQYFLTWKHFNEQHDKQSLALLTILATRDGFPHGNFTLYQAYSGGYGVEMNPVAADYYLKQAADKHFTLALITLGDQYFKGKGAPQNIEKAKALFRDAARQDSPEGAEKFRQAGGDPREIGPTASELLQMTRRLNKRTPELARKYIHDGIIGAEYALAFYKYRTSSGKPPREALELMEKAAFDNVALAYMALGEIFENGVGVNTRPAEAVLWYALGYEVTEDPKVRTQIGSKIEHAARKVDFTAFSKIQDFVPSLGLFSQSSLR